MSNPTPEQVEAARAEYDRSEDMCAALVAAAGAAPQERECQCYGADDVTDQKCNVCAAPVQVDEAKLAEIVRRVDSHEWSRMGGSQGEQVADIVRAVLRGGGQ